MQLFNHYHHHFSLSKLMHSEFWLFELSVWLHVFGRSLVSIFIPILLLTAGYSIEEVIIYYLIFNVFDVPLNFLARWLIKKLGARMVIGLGIFSLIAFFIVLFNLAPNNWPLLILLALFSALYDAFYWVAHFYFFAESGKARHSAAKDVSIFYIVRKIGSMLAPALGAIVLIFFEQKILIAVAIVILILSLWPLIKMKKTSDRPKGKQPSFGEFFKNKKDLKGFFTVSLWGMHGAAEGIIWPMFIFIVFESIESVAIVPIIVSLTTIVFTYFTGKIDKHARGNMLVLGSLMIAIVWILRLLLDGSIFLFASIFLVGLFSILISVPNDSDILEQGQKKDALTASTYRNTFSMSSRVLFYGILAILVNVFNMSFIIAAVAMFLIVAVTLLFKGKVGQSIGPKEMAQV